MAEGVAGHAPVPAHVPQDRVVDIDVYAPRGTELGFQEAWAALQAASPAVVWTPRNEGHWIALGGEALHDVQSDAERFSSRVIVLPKSIGELHGLIPTTIDPPAHRPYRLLLNANLQPAAIRGLAEKVRGVAADLIDSFAADGWCDFTAQYATIFPIRIFLSLVDLPESDAPKIRYWADCMTRPDPDIPFEAARQAFFDYLDPVIRARREVPGEDMLSRMLHADMDGRKLGHEEALSICTQVLIAGVDTVVNFLSFALLALARDPLVRAEVADHPQGAIGAVNELFRRFGLVTIAREVSRDIEFHGVTLKAGDMIAIPTAVHGIDPSVNPDPMRLDFRRPSPRHSAFGSGPHMCPGQELARREVAITLEEWLKRLPAFEVAPESDLSVVPGIVGSLRRLCLQWPKP
jgi:camphor 5-monooxygenase